MSKQIFESKPEKNKPQYVKVKENANLHNIGKLQKHEDDEDEFVIGEPVFEKEEKPEQNQYPQMGYWGNKHLWWSQT